MTAPDAEPLAARVPPPGGMPPPSDARVDVWWAHTGVSASTFEALRADLDPETIARVNALAREADRRRGVVGHGLLRRLISAATGAQPQAVRIARDCRTCGATDHGKPYLATAAPAGRPPLRFNLSHAGEIVAVALAGPSTEVGLDVETIDAHYDWAPSRRHVFTDDEWTQTTRATNPARDRFAQWARKEAAVKATGHGLLVDLRHVTFEPAPSGGAGRVGGFTAPDGHHQVHVTDLALLGGMAGAVAIVVPRGQPQPPTVAVTRADLGA